MKLFLLAILISSTTWLVAQNVHTERLTWSVNSTVNLKNNDQFNYECIFKTDGNHDILWVQKQGQKVVALSITSVEGEWTNVFEEGSITYQITDNGLRGTLTVKRVSKNEQPTIVIDFSAESETGMQQKFIVSQVQPGK